MTRFFGSRSSTLAFALMLGLAALIFFSAGAVLAGDIAPQVPKAKGDACVEDTDFMRRNHFELLKHQRDETVHNGIRTKKHSLRGCMSCHAQPNEQGVTVTAESEEHFCTTCHVFAAVKVDCWMCHASTPDGPDPHGMRGSMTKATGQ